MLKADGGTLYIVAVEDDVLMLHMAGQCSGCPGAPTTSKSIIEPLVRSLASGIRLAITAGARMPQGAIAIEEFEVEPSEGQKSG